MTAPDRDHRPRRFTGLSFALAGVLVLVCALAWLMARYASGPLLEEPRMRVGLVAVPEQEPLMAARERGELGASRVLVVELGSLEALRNAFLDGNVHAGVFTLDEALRLCEPPTRARIERVLGRSRATLTLMARPGIAGVSDLRGCAVGLESGRHAMTALRELLAAQGLGLADVRLHQLDVDSAPELLASGTVAAALVYEPATSRLVARGFGALARWRPAGEGDLMVLLSSERAHRRAAGQLAYLGSTWFAGVAALHSGAVVDSALANREGLAQAEASPGFAPARWFTPAEDRLLRGAAGREELRVACAAIAADWRALGVADTVPSIASWLPSGEARP